MASDWGGRGAKTWLDPDHLLRGEPAIFADGLEGSMNGREELRMILRILDLSKWKDGTVLNGDGKMEGEAVRGRLLK